MSETDQYLTYGLNQISVDEALEIQKDLARRVTFRNSFDDVKSVAGADISVNRKKKKLICTIVVLSYPQMEVLEEKFAIEDEKFPYIPNLLAFREAPAVISAYGSLESNPQVLILDGHGIAHPRRLGLASHVGVLLDIPTIGVAKKRLFGAHREPCTVSGSRSDLTDPSCQETIGVVLRTKDNVKPVFVSVGNNIDLETAVGVVLNCTKGYRIPEPTRQADIFAAKIKKELA